MGEYSSAREAAGRIHPEMRARRRRGRRFFMGATWLIFEG